VDLALSLYPLRLGSPEWEFGTASRLLDNLPLFTVGVMLQMASAAAAGAGVRLTVLKWLMPVAVAVVAVAIVLLQEVVEPTARLLLQKAAAKTFVQAAAYSALYGAAFLMARRAGR